MNHAHDRFFLAGLLTVLISLVFFNTSALGGMQVTDTTSLDLSASHAACSGIIGNIYTQTCGSIDASYNFTVALLIIGIGLAGFGVVKYMQWKQS